MRCFRVPAVGASTSRSQPRLTTHRIGRPPLCACATLCTPSTHLAERAVASLASAAPPARRSSKGTTSWGVLYTTDSISVAGVWKMRRNQIRLYQSHTALY